jgi:hypothetical protein
MPTNNVYRLLPSQVPKFWEVIKQATVDETDSKRPQIYWNKLLHSLLSDTSQCFIELDSERILRRLLITKIEIDKDSKEKRLFMRSYYPAESVDASAWARGIDILKQLARSEGCSSIAFVSSDKGMYELSTSTGFKENGINLLLEL